MSVSGQAKPGQWGWLLIRKEGREKESVVTIIYILTYLWLAKRGVGRELGTLLTLNSVHRKHLV